MDRPLADRIRPKTLDEVVGQRHLLGPNALLRRFIEKGTDANHLRPKLLQEAEVPQKALVRLPGGADHEARAGLKADVL